VGLLPSILRLTIDLHKEVGFRGPVITLGNQDTYASYADLVAMFEERGCPISKPAEVTPHSSLLFEQAYAERAREFVHARTFFAMLGIDEYLDVDLLDDDRPIIHHDLNLPVPDELRDRFGLVFDSGTLEHIFDVRACLENITAMARVGGWVLHFSPASNLVDHGFYSISPTLFFDFYRANGFERERCVIFEWNPLDPWERCPYFAYRYGMQLNGLLDPRRATMICFAARKREAVEPRVPLQGSYDPARTEPFAAGAWATGDVPPIPRDLI
jgi:hypothetical protein